MDHPIICFGQQPCGFFPKRFLFAKILTARRLQKKIGGEVVFFFHDSDHDPRETITILRERNSNKEAALNFQFENRIQKKFSPLYAKRVLPEWQEKTARQLPNYVGRSLVAHFKETKCSNIADFCLEMYCEWGCWKVCGWNDRVHPNSELVLRPSQTTSSISAMKERSFAHVFVTGSCCYIREAIGFYRFPEENSVRSKSARLATRVSDGCNQ